MLASFSAQLTEAAAIAQTVLGETFTIENDSTTYTGVLDEREGMLPATINGLELVKEMVITATKPQFTTAPSAAGRPKITARSSTWTLTAVRNGPFHYHLTCVPSS